MVGGHFGSFVVGWRHNDDSSVALVNNTLREEPDPKGPVLDSIEIYRMAAFKLNAKIAITSVRCFYRFVVSNPFQICKALAFACIKIVWSENDNEIYIVRIYFFGKKTSVNNQNSRNL